MLGIFVATCCVLMTRAAPPTSGYSHGTLSGGRGQEYNGAYRTDGFVGMKDSQGDFSDNTGSNRYAVITGGSGHSSTTGSSYVSDAGYPDTDIINGQTGAFGGQTNVGSGNSPNLSGSSYSSDHNGQLGSSEYSGSSYPTSGSSSGGHASYPAGGTTGSVGNHAGTGYTDYSEASIGGQSAGAFSSGLSGIERGEYSSSRPASSYASYTVGGPKSSAYVSSGSGHGGQGHAVSSYSPSPSYSLSAHRGVSSLSSSSYPSETSHPVVSSGPSYSSGQSLKSFLAGIHGPGNYVQHVSGSHRTTPAHHLFAPASNPMAGYTSRGPGSGYYPSSNPYHRGNGNPGGKVIVVKESNSAIQPGHVYPGEHHSYSGGMFPSNSGYKIRNVASGASHGPPNFANVYSSAGNYNGASSLHSSNNKAGSFFSFL